MHFPLTWIGVLFLCSAFAHGGKVLVFPFEGSHWVNMKVIIEELHARGHQVSVVRPKDSWEIKETSPFYTSITIDIEGVYDESFAKTFISSLLKILRQKSTWAQFQLQKEYTQKAIEMHQTNCKILEFMFADNDLMQSLQDAKYDLVLTDPVMPSGTIFAHYLSLPLVFNVRWTSHGEGLSKIAPSPLSYVPQTGAQLSDKMNFMERIVNILIFAVSELSIRYYITPHYDGLLGKYLGPDVDYVSLFQAADLWLLRVDLVFEFPRPTMPNVVYMGGFQCKPAKPLPQDLEDFVQSSGEHGVVIMSLGTLIGALPHDLADEIAAAFAQLPQKVIWKYKGDRPATLGNNTLLVDWMPQNDLLGHEKTKVFISHGGTNGVYEAIYHGVPIIGLPLVFDQNDNLLRMEIQGAAKIINIFTMTKDVLLKGIEEALHDPSYMMNMQRLSRLHRDTPVKPLDSAIFWIEFVMRHKGAAHLRTDSYKMPWYSYHSVDVIVTLLAAVAVITSLLIACVQYFCVRKCYKRKIKNE